MSLRRMLVATLLVVLVAAGQGPEAAAADAVIVRLEAGRSIQPVLDLLGGEVVDFIPDARTYLISVPALPPTWLPVPGASYIEPNQLVAMPTVLESAILTGSDTTAADWYAEQSALQVVRAGEARAMALGEGVVVADIDARFDFAHPSLNGHWTNGYDFVAEREAREAGLDQSSASFMFTDDGFLDQSSASFMFGDEGLLDQSSASFMFGDEGLLDQSSASFMFEENGLKLLSPLVRVLDPPSAAYSHGTLTAGLIAVTAPEAQIMPIRAFDDEGQADLFTLAKSVRYAAQNGADVVNMSWGTLSDSPTLRDAIRFAVREGLVLVTSAGNMNSDMEVYPAASPGVVAVASTDDRDQKAAFSNYGPHISVSAPGVNIISAYPGGSYAVTSGTSFSSPIAAGEAALVLSLGASDVGSVIEDSSVGIDRANPAYRGQLGSGRIDMRRATEASKGTSSSQTGLFGGIW